MRRGAMLDELISGVVLNAMTAGTGAGAVGKYAGRMIKVAKVGKYGGHVLGLGKRWHPVGDENTLSHNILRVCILIKTESGWTKWWRCWRQQWLMLLLWSFCLEVDGDIILWKGAKGVRGKWNSRSKFYFCPNIWFEQVLLDADTNIFSRITIAPAPSNFLNRGETVGRWYLFIKVVCEKHRWWNNKKNKPEVAVAYIFSRCAIVFFFSFFFYASCFFFACAQRVSTRHLQQHRQQFKRLSRPGGRVLDHQLGDQEEALG